MWIWPPFPNQRPFPFWLSKPHGLWPRQLALRMAGTAWPVPPSLCAALVHSHISFAFTLHPALIAVPSCPATCWLSDFIQLSGLPVGSVPGAQLLCEVLFVLPWESNLSQWVSIWKCFSVHFSKALILKGTCNSKAVRNFGESWRVR